MGENNFWILQFLFPPAFAPPLPPSTSNTEASWPPHFAQRSIILTKAPELPSGLSQGGAAEVPHLCSSMCNGLPEQGHLLSGKHLGKDVVVEDDGGGGGGSVQEE